jgi:murein DD-endopeptidase MepM/ murein hydrolase activator NlpD
MPQFFQYKRIWLGMILVLFLSAIIFWQIDSNSTLTLTIDGKEVAVVNGEGIVNQTIDQIKSDLEESGMPIAGYDNQIAYIKGNTRGKDPISETSLHALLKDELNWQTECWKIKIDGKPDLYMQSEDAAKQALKLIKEYYLPDEGITQELEKIAFVEEVSIQKELSSIVTLHTPETAVEAMVKGLNKIIQHTVVKGDTLWAIALDNNMTVDELKEINTELTSDFLKLGQSLNLVKVEPLLTVVATIKTTAEEKIQYKTTYESDDTLWRGQQRVKKSGEYGQREVTYRITRENDHEINREILQENIITEPVTQIVLQGTKRMLASRGDGGTGKLAWPLRGRITSPYGKYRGSWGVHSGVDIDGVVGDPIYSAEDGVVLDARYQGLYGRCIIIDHGNGLSTLYAHLNEYKVTTGQKVSRGDLIGTVGLTGRTTGSHLHFEVRVNTKHTNPMNYLN